MIHEFLRRNIVILLLVFPLLVQAQIQRPVKWSFKADRKENKVTVTLNATIDAGWHVYSQNLPAGGPIPTSFTFTPSADYTLSGKVSEPPSEEIYDANFDMKVRYFGESAVFRQKLDAKTDKAFSVNGKLEFMVCNDQMCLPPEEVEFSIPVSGTDAGSAPVSKDTASQSVPAESVDSSSTGQLTTPSVSAPGEPSGDMSALEPDCNDGAVVVEEDKSFLGIFIAGLIGGFLALLTPCVFPMIPLTVSFFTKRSPTRAKGMANAIIYSVSIILIYVLLGFLVTVTLGSDALNAMASNVYFNMLFFIIFFIFALSFFGAFEITLPTAWVNKADQASDRGGLIGIFFMAFTLSLVSFSCTGPIIGTLLVEAARGSSYLGPIMGMTGFALALALPFGLFAAFPGWLNSLPKSGGWLNSVKVVLGFLELALALKFLSNVDLAYHWGLLKREVFIAIWIVIFGLMGLYLLGKLRFSHDSELPYLGTARLIFAILALTFTVYLVPGLWGAPLRMISGFPPPEFYKEWTHTGEAGATAHAESCPHGLECYHDYEAGMAYAQSVGKPVMIDFTGWSCVNCRKMEDNVWSQPEILGILKEKYVLISLYVDDKTALPESQQYVSTFSQKKIKTTGARWSDLQSRVYQTNSQPYYVLLDHDGKPLAKPVGYTPNVTQYKQFLEEGLCRFTIRSSK
ncbi:MAG: thioredoxin family protein [Sphingobacteriales bacterium]|nr:thioredoxin family protein [Sphingobacteriales bacterium]